MSRPEFITAEDIQRWSEIVDKDVGIPETFKGFDLLREVLYASFWMAENLKKEGCPDEIIVRIQYTMGQLSFGHDPWQIAQEMLEAYKNNEMEFEFDYNEDA
jgi:hypothetical protein